LSADEARDAASRVEELGYHTLWIGEGPQNKEIFANAGILLAATETLVVATGVANLHARDALAMRTGSLALGDAYPGRFVLGIGVSHASLVTARGHDYAKPLTTMREYLDAMDDVDYRPPMPAVAVPRLLAALRPRMLELSRDRAQGAHTYFVPVSHTRMAREALGDDAGLYVELMVVLEEDPARARAVARQTVGFYLSLPNYVNSLRALGYGDDDLSAGGSDRLVDDLVAWGSPLDIAARVSAHHEAGADHVALQPLGGGVAQALTVLAKLAPAVLPL